MRCTHTAACMSLRRRRRYLALALALALAQALALALSLSLTQAGDAERPVGARPDQARRLDVPLRGGGHSPQHLTLTPTLSTPT